MSNELIISNTQDGCRIALLRDKTLVEFHQEEEGSKFTVGDIYLGTVKKVVQGLNAAFVDVGYDKDAFLHYLDLGPQFSSLNKFTKLTRGKKIYGKLEKFTLEPDIDKHGKIKRVDLYAVVQIGSWKGRLAGIKVNECVAGFQNTLNKRSAVRVLTLEQSLKIPSAGKVFIAALDSILTRDHKGDSFGRIFLNILYGCFCNDKTGCDNGFCFCASHDSLCPRASALDDDLSV